MGRSSKKPRQKFNPKKFEGVKESEKKKEKDWTFEDIARSKARRR
jgi:hypothetical protein